MVTVLLVAHIIVVVCLIVVILLQPSSAEGFVSSGSGGMDSFLSSRASSNILTKLTAFLAAAFIGLSLALAWIATHTDKKSLLDAQPQQMEETSPSIPVEGGKVEEAPVSEPASPPSVPME